MVSNNQRGSVILLCFFFLLEADISDVLSCSLDGSGDVLIGIASC